MRLKEIDLHVTNKCSLRCQHCVFSSGDRQLDEMSSQEVFDLINQFSSLSRNQGAINIFGGEVLLREDIFKIIARAKAGGLSVGITSNCHAPAELKEKLLSTDIDRITSDLDGAIQETHDSLRNMDGNFTEVIEMLKQSRAKKIYTTVNSVLSKRNIDQAPAILELCEEIGVDAMAFYFLTPTGRGLRLADEIIGAREWLETKEKVLTWIKINSPRFSVCWEEAYESLATPIKYACRCEKKYEESIFIRCDGEAYSCALLEAAPCSLGNIRREKLEKILSRRAERALSRSKGCPALAFYKHHDLNGADPRAESDGIKLGCPYNYHILNEK